MERRIVFAPEALDDLLQIQDTIAEASTPERALAYVQRLRAHCLGFATFPERGTRRDEVRPGLRTVGFGRRVTSAFDAIADALPATASYAACATWTVPSAGLPAVDADADPPPAPWRKPMAPARVKEPFTQYMKLPNREFTLA